MRAPAEAQQHPPPLTPTHAHPRPYIDQCCPWLAGEGGLGRTNQYMLFVIENMEQVRMIRNYRTPVMMRNACGVLIHVFTVALAPYFVHFCDSWVSYGRDLDTCPAGYAATIVYTTIEMLLYNVQQDIEQPFDMTGLDDVFFELADEFDEVRYRSRSRCEISMAGCGHICMANCVHHLVGPSTYAHSTSALLATSQVHMPS